jgi:hypothetical protein
MGFLGDPGMLRIGRDNVALYSELGAVTLAVRRDTPRDRFG